MTSALRDPGLWASRGTPPILRKDCCITTMCYLHFLYISLAIYFTWHLIFHNFPPLYYMCICILIVLRNIPSMCKRVGLSVVSMLLPSFHLSYTNADKTGPQKLFRAPRHVHRVSGMTVNKSGMEDDGDVWKGQIWFELSLNVQPFICLCLVTEQILCKKKSNKTIKINHSFTPGFWVKLWFH